MGYNQFLKNALIIFLSVQLSACEKAQETNMAKPAIVKNIAGSALHEIILTVDAFKRLDIQTVKTTETNLQGTLWKVVPYSSVLYDPEGNAWVYKNFNGFSFVRMPIKIARIKGEQVILFEGPPTGTLIVTVGAAELYGTEYQGIIQP